MVNYYIVYDLVVAWYLFLLSELCVPLAFGPVSFVLSCLTIILLIILSHVRASERACVCFSWQYATLWSVIVAFSGHINLLLTHWYPGSSVVLDCIDS